MDGYVPTENLRFRDASLVFKVAETANEEEVKKMCMYKYPGMKKKMGEFELAIVAGEFTDSEIMVMLGENGEFSLYILWYLEVCSFYTVTSNLVLMLSENFDSVTGLGAELNPYISQCSSTHFVMYDLICHAVRFIFLTLLYNVSENNMFF